MSAKWQILASEQPKNIPVTIYEWLSDRGSMTLRLRKVSKEIFEVKLREQFWQLPLPEEALLLGLNSDESAVIREVDLCCDGKTWIFGRSIFPKALLDIKQEELSNLGNRPLGEVLFADPSLRRSQIEFTLLKSKDFLFIKALQDDINSSNIDALWARRSLCFISEQPLLVTEIFLADMFRTYV